MKGIDPLIATVLLIAATMSIAGILVYWASNFVRTTLPETNSSETTCQFADFQISSCNYANNTVSFVLYNYRNVPLNGIRATVFDVNNFPSWSNMTLNQSLPVGQFVSFSIQNIPSNFTKLTVVSTECPSLIHETPC